MAAIAAKKLGSASPLGVIGVYSNLSVATHMFECQSDRHCSKTKTWDKGLKLYPNDKTEGLLYALGLQLPGDIASLLTQNHKMTSKDHRIPSEEIIPAGTGARERAGTLATQEPQADLAGAWPQPGSAAKGPMGGYRNQCAVSAGVLLDVFHERDNPRSVAWRENPAEAGLWWTIRPIAIRACVYALPGRPVSFARFCFEHLHCIAFPRQYHQLRRRIQLPFYYLEPFHHLVFLIEVILGHAFNSRSVV